MKDRCLNPNNKKYPIYGGRGILICKRWQSSFYNFLEDMGKVSKGHQIDRVDNSGNYCKSNCRWTTRKQQGRNKRNNCLITFEGRTQCLSAWAEEIDIKMGTLWQRLTRGWSIEKILTVPTKRKGQKK